MTTNHSVPQQALNEDHEYLKSTEDEIPESFRKTNASDFAKDIAEQINAAIKWSDCRELVIVENSPGYILSVLESKYGASFSFRLPRETVWFMHYEPEDEEFDLSKGFHENVTRTLSGKIIDDYSPRDFFFVPKRALRVRDRVNNLLDTTIVRNLAKPLSQLHAEAFKATGTKVYIGMFCLAPYRSFVDKNGNNIVLNEDDLRCSFRRAVVTSILRKPEEIIGNSIFDHTVLVNLRFVDEGKSDCVSVQMLRAIPKIVGSQPITSLQCRIANVQDDDLYQSRLVEFREKICALKYMVRIQPVKFGEIEQYGRSGAFSVHLIHPTQYNINLGEVFYRRTPMANQQRKLSPPCIRIKRGEDIEADYFDEKEKSQELDEEIEHNAIIHWGKLERPAMGELSSGDPVTHDVVVSNVINGKNIFVVPLSYVPTLIATERFLLAHFAAEPTYGQRCAWSRGEACCVCIPHDAAPCFDQNHPAGLKLRWVRGIIQDKDEIDKISNAENARVMLIDYGINVKLPTIEAGCRIRAPPLNISIMHPPLVWACKLDGLLDWLVHATHTVVLRRLLTPPNLQHWCKPAFIQLFGHKFAPDDADSIIDPLSAPFARLHPYTTAKTAAKCQVPVRSQLWIAENQHTPLTKNEYQDIIAYRFANSNDRSSRNLSREVMAPCKTAPFYACSNVFERMLYLSYKMFFCRFGVNDTVQQRMGLVPYHRQNILCEQVRSVLSQLNYWPYEWRYEQLPRALTRGDMITGCYQNIIQPSDPYGEHCLLWSKEVIDSLRLSIESYSAEWRSILENAIELRDTPKFYPMEDVEAVLGLTSAPDEVIKFVC